MFFTLKLLIAIAASAGPAKHVVVISIDGGKPSTIEKTNLPTLHSLAREGASSWAAETILPSVTLPSHASMVSGVDVNVHGLTWNDYKPNRGPIRTTTMFAEAKAGGVSTALIVAKEKLKHLILPGSIDTFELVSAGDLAVAKAAASHLSSKLPGLTLIHLAGVDSAGHRHGWDTAPYLDALRVADRAVAIVKKSLEESGLAKNTILLITADHGGSGKGHGSARPEHRNIPWILWGTGVKVGLTLPSRISTMDTAATALWALGVKIPAGWQGQPVREAF
jgi:predicted AlkP superfamily pyrophosphatase or phosphodiesterase